MLTVKTIDDRMYILILFNRERLHMKKYLIAVLIIFLIGNYEICEAEISNRVLGGYMPYIEVVDELPIPVNNNENESIKLMTMTAEEGTTEEISGTEYYGWNTILNQSTRLAEAYLHLARGLVDREEIIDFSEFILSYDEFKKIFNACVNDWPQLYYVDTGYSYMLPSPYMTRVKLDYIDYLDSNYDYKLFETAADKIIKESGVRAEMSDYDKAIVLHDELIRRIEYDHDVYNAYQSAYKIEDETERANELARLDSMCEHVHSAYGALVYEKAVCDGYAKAYQYLLYKVGILSHMATGPGHAWNLVRLDGKWYYTDLTWDDTDEWEIFYEFFNITDAQLIESGHSIENPYTMPVCYATEHNYFVRNGGMMSVNGDIENVVEQLRKHSYARVYITGDIENTVKIINWYEENIDEIAERLGIQTGYWYNFKGNKYSREFHLILYQDIIYPLRNVSVEIGSTTNKECEIIIAFYDEDDVLIKVYRENIYLDEINMKRLKYFGAPARFKKIKYFIWDKENGLKPIYNVATATY